MYILDNYQSIEILIILAQNSKYLAQNSKFLAQFLGKDFKF
jgi:hypothetical protein